MYSNGYTVVVGTYAKKHYIKRYEKNYKTARAVTWKAINNLLLRLDQFLLTSKAEVIYACKQGDIIKCEFKIAGSNISAHASGNRYIVYREFETGVLSILLLHSKDDVQGKETARWRGEIKENYKKIGKVFWGKGE